MIANANQPYYRRRNIVDEIQTNGPGTAMQIAAAIHDDVEAVERKLFGMAKDNQLTIFVVRNGYCIFGLAELVVAMMRPTYRAWVWLDPKTNQPRYIGYGSSRFGEMPWDREWDNRGGSSELSQWLATLDRPPLRDPTISDTVFFRETAAKYAAQIRKGINAKLLRNRTYEGTQTGGGAAKAVIDPEGDLFVSVRAAARDRGVDVGTICHYLKHSAKTGWRYFDPDYQAKRAAPSNCCLLCGMHGSVKELIAGPDWATSGICKKCDRVIKRLEKENQLQPSALLALGESMIATARGEHQNPRIMRRYVNDDTPGFPRWLRTVAGLIESSKKLC